MLFVRKKLHMQGIEKMPNLNVIILANGKAIAGSNERMEQYPDYLTEHNGIPLIEYLIRQCEEIGLNKITCFFPGSEVARYHLHNMVEQISPMGNVIAVQGQTAGAACTALLAIEEIDNDRPLLILGSNEFLSIPLKSAVDHFQESNADAGVFSFKSVHPRYAFVRFDENSEIIEVAEKNPISPHAIAGVFWFRKGSDFVGAVKSMIRKDIKINGSFYISPALNELILEGKVIISYSISSEQYCSLRSSVQLYAFEAAVNS